MPDVPRPVATSPDTAYSLSIEDAAHLYARAGHPRTQRTIQRYCSSGHLECVKAATLLGDKYYIEPDSVARHIAQIEELSSLANRALGLGMSRQDATADTAQNGADTPRHTHTTQLDVSRQDAAGHAAFPAASSLGTPDIAADTSRPVATGPVADNQDLLRTDNEASRHVAALEREVERLAEDKVFLREQIATKDNQISALLERDRETNILVRTLQQMLSPLLGSGRDRDPHDDRQTFDA